MLRVVEKTPEGLITDSNWVVSESPSSEHACTELIAGYVKNLVSESAHTVG